MLLLNHRLLLMSPTASACHRGATAKGRVGDKEKDNIRVVSGEDISPQAALLPVGTTCPEPLSGKIPHLQPLVTVTGIWGAWPCPLALPPPEDA